MPSRVAWTPPRTRKILANQNKLFPDKPQVCAKDVQDIKDIKNVTKDGKEVTKVIRDTKEVKDVTEDVKDVTKDVKDVIKDATIDKKEKLNLTKTNHVKKPNQDKLVSSIKPRPIRVQNPGQVVTLDQSEASIKTHNGTSTKVIANDKTRGKTPKT